MAGAVMEFSAANFDQEVMKSPTPVLVDLWAAWCVDPRAQIMLDQRDGREARLVRVEHGTLSVNQHGLTVGRVTHAVISGSLGHCQTIETESGRRLRVTDDHQFLTRGGWAAAADLRPGTEVAVYPAIEPIARATSSCPMLTLEQIRRASLGRMKRSLYLEQLKRQRLVPFEANDPRAPVVARLVGALFSDGHLYQHEANNYRELMWIVGRREDADQICHDLSVLGFTATITERTTANQIDGRRFTVHTYRVKCNSTAAWLFFKGLGVPEGKKTDCRYLAPRWVLRAPRIIQREFLAAYLGGDGPTPTIRLVPRPPKEPCDSAHPNDIELHKRTDLAENGYRFAKQLATLLKPFGVKARKVWIERVGSPRKDGSRTDTIHVALSGGYESMYALCHHIGYAYAASKSAQAETVGEFLRKKLFERAQWQQRYRQAKRLYRQGRPMDEVAGQLQVPYNTVYQWLRRGVRPTIGYHHERYGDWLSRVTEGAPHGVVWERVNALRPVYLPKVARLSVEPSHSFIANGFVVHNCGPCRMIAPMVEELAGTYQGKMKMGKLNVDDHPAVAGQFRVMNIPTLLFFKGGREVDRIVGVVPKEELVRRIEAVLS